MSRQEFEPFFYNTAFLNLVIKGRMSAASEQ